MNYRTAYARIVVDGDRAIGAGIGTLDYLLRRHAQLEGEGIYIDGCCLAEMDSADEWGRYIKFIMDWAISHRGNESKGMSPPCFDEFCDNELCEVRGGD